MDKFIKVIEKDPQVQIKIKDVLDKYIRLPDSYQPKRGYDTLIQNVILKKIINLLSIIIVDTDIKLKVKVDRLKFIESILLGWHN